LVRSRKKKPFDILCDRPEDRRVDHEDNVVRKTEEGFVLILSASTRWIVFVRRE
jgi:hypothetical protein